MLGYVVRRVVFVVVIIIMIITSNDDLQPSTVIMNLSPSGLVLSY